MLTRYTDGRSAPHEWFIFSLQLHEVLVRGDEIEKYFHKRATNL